MPWIVKYLKYDIIGLLFILINFDVSMNYKNAAFNQKIPSYLKSCLKSYPPSVSKENERRFDHEYDLQ